MDLRKNDRITGANVVVEVDAPETPAVKEEDLVIAAAGVPVKKDIPEAAEENVDAAAAEKAGNNTENPGSDE
jgi:hypothetical protein